jgi:hypothetical protein
VSPLIQEVLDVISPTEFALSPDANRLCCELPSVFIRLVRVDRHSLSAGHPLVFGSINARSIANQLNDQLEIRRDLLINVLFVVDTRHDADSALRCLRSDGSQIIDRPRPRLASDVDTLSTNHGGLAVIGTPGIRLTQLHLDIRPGSFEMLCVRIT